MPWIPWGSSRGQFMRLVRHLVARVLHSEEPMRLASSSLANLQPQGGKNDLQAARAREAKNSLRTCLHHWLAQSKEPWKLRDSVHSLTHPLILSDPGLLLRLGSSLSLPLAPPQPGPCPSSTLTYPSYMLA